jgi:phytoene synthase
MVCGFESRSSHHFLFHPARVRGLPMAWAATPASYAFRSVRLNPDDYCEHKGAPRGSTAYYALREASRAARPGLVALSALHSELVEAQRKASDPLIAATKLGWWRQEVARLGASEPPTHPVTTALSRHLAPESDTWQLLDTLVAGYEQGLQQSRFTDFNALQRHLAHTAGALGVLWARHAAAAGNGRPSPSRDDWSARLGVALALAYLVRDAGDDTRHGHIFIPLDEMQRFGVPAATIVQRRYDDAYRGLMAFQTERARAQLHAAVLAIPGDEWRAQRTLRAQGAMALALLDEIENAGYEVLHQRISLTPVRKLLVAWRGARRRQS